MMFWLLLPILALAIIALLVWLDDDVDTPTTLRTLSVMRLACYTYRAPTPADVAMHRVLTRARLLSGIRDTWRLAYCIARLDHQGK
jgi:hypothetical protein